MKPSEQFDYNFVIFADCVPAMLARFVVRVCYKTALCDQKKLVLPVCRLVRWSAFSVCRKLWFGSDTMCA